MTGVRSLKVILRLLRIKGCKKKIDDAIYKNALFESSLGLSNVDNNIISIFEAIQQAAPEANLESLKSAISSYRKAYGDVVYEEI